MNNNLSRKITEWWYFITRGIKNLVYWFPLIWNDRDWDHAYMEYILLHKLKRMYKRFSDPTATYVDWTYEYSAKALQALRICIVILERRKSSFTLDLYGPIKQHMAIEDRDQKVLYSLMNQYSTCWWD